MGERDVLLEDLARIAGIAGEHNKRLAYEALAWGTHINDHRDAWALVRDVGHLEGSNRRIHSMNQKGK